MISRLCLCLSLALVAVNSVPITKERLRFKISAKGLPDKDDGLGTTDGYVQILFTEGGSNREKELGRTSTISDNENPDWGKIFEFDFDRSKSQKWHIRIWDEDHLREDDKAGQVWIDVTDYVDKGQLVNANLDKKGYITIRSDDAQVQRSTQTTPGSLPYAPGSPDTGVLTFKVSANGLPDKDKLGRTDPYVEIFSTEGPTGKKVKVGRSNTLSNTKNPQWGESFTFNWDRRKDQRWYFKIYDNDNFREDDTVGKAWVEVNDYVAKGQVMTVNLNKKGLLTISRADGLPPNPYNPAQTAQIQQVPATPSMSNQQRLSSNVPLSSGQNQNVQQPLPLGPPTPSISQPRKLRFKLSGSNFPDKDILGTSDPYVRVYVTQDGASEKLLKKGSTLNNNENPQWPDVYELNYDPSKNQRLRFLVLDEDDNKRDEEIGNVSLDASDLEQRNYIVLNLPQGKLTVSKL